MKNPSNDEIMELLRLTELMTKSWEMKDNFLPDLDTSTTERALYKHYKQMVKK